MAKAQDGRYLLSSDSHILNGCMIYGRGQDWERNLEATIAYGLVLPKSEFAILGTIEDA